MTNYVLKTQKGLSLIELMIAITLSMFIVAAMISLFVNSKENYRMNENMSRLQENARFAVSFISRDVRMADYRACIVGPNSDRNTNAISGQNGTTDTVTITWQADNCTGEITTEYSIQEGASGNSLFKSETGVNGGLAQEIVEGIENLQILYGHDTNGDDVPDYYVDTAAESDLSDAVSVRFTLTARTLESNLSAVGGGITRDFTSTVALRNRLP